MPERIAAVSLFLSLMLIPAYGQDAGEVTSIDDLAALMLEASSEAEIGEIAAAGSEAGLSDYQIAAAFGLSIETLLAEGPRERLPVLMGGFESFVSASGEPADAISAALESGQDLALSRAEAGDPMITPPVSDGARPPQSSLRPSPLGGGASARGATGGGGGGVVSGGASPS